MIPVKASTLLIASVILLGGIATPVAAADPPPGYGTCHIEEQSLGEPITIGPITYEPTAPRLVCYW